MRTQVSHVILMVRLSAGAAMVLAIGGCSDNRSEFAHDTVENVSVKLDRGRDSPGSSPDGGFVSSSDKGKIENLLAVLRSAKSTTDHKCGDSGQITLHKKDGSDVTLGILAGHKAAYYEFRLYEGKKYKIYRADRQDFLAAMAAIGLSGLDLGYPE